MAAPTTPEEALDAATLRPKEVSKDREKIVERDLDELQDAVDRAAGAVAATTDKFGLRFVALNSPGCGG